MASTPLLGFSVMEKSLFQASSYDFSLPGYLIAQEPCRPRDKSRLLVADRAGGFFQEKVFKEIISFFQKGDALVLNNTKVVQARLLGKKESGGRVEALLINKTAAGIWECLLKPAKRIKLESGVIFSQKYRAVVKKRTQSGLFQLKFYPEDTEALIAESGKTPLPPYIKKDAKPRDYQTVYAQKSGAVAAPTAGLHFTKPLIEKIRKKGVRIVCITLHCSLATFRPVKAEDIRKHPMAQEYVEISPRAAAIINKAKKEKRKVFAVGTTAVRSLESAVCGFRVKPFLGPTGLYITPGYKFKVVDALITNFHTPLSTNLILVSAFASLKFIRQAYSYARQENFRFFSFGDAMLIL